MSCGGTECLLYCIWLVAALQARSPRLAALVAEERAQEGIGLIGGRGCPYAEGETRNQVSFLPGCRDPPMGKEMAYYHAKKRPREGCVLPGFTGRLSLTHSSERMGTAGRTSCARAVCPRKLPCARPTVFTSTCATCGSGHVSAEVPCRALPFFCNTLPAEERAESARKRARRAETARVRRASKKMTSTVEETGHASLLFVASVEREHIALTVSPIMAGVLGRSPELAAQARALAKGVVEAMLLPTRCSPPAAIPPPAALPPPAPAAALAEVLLLDVQRQAGTFARQAVALGTEKGSAPRACGCLFLVASPQRFRR